MVMHKMIKIMHGIFFDLYGTLFIYGNMQKAWADWLHHFHLSLRARGLRLSEEDFAKQCDRFFGKDEPASTEPNLTVFEKRIKALCSFLGIKLADEDIGRIADLIAHKWQEEIKLDQEAIPVLKKLKEDKILGLISNFDHPRHVRKYISYYGLNGFFKTIIISGDVGVKKPDPGIFEPALSATGLIPADVAYVGDTGEDVEAAKASGMMPILIKRQDRSTDGDCLDFENDSQNRMKEDQNETRKSCMTISALRELLCI